MSRQSISEAVEVLPFGRYASGGGGSSHYSNPQVSAALGQARTLVVYALVLRSTGQSLTLVAEDSADAQSWAEVGTVLTTPAGTPEPIERLRGTVTAPFGRYVRLRADLSGGAQITLAVRAATQQS